MMTRHPRRKRIAGVAFSSRCWDIYAERGDHTSGSGEFPSSLRQGAGEIVLTSNGDWGSLVSTVLHELMEIELMSLRLTYQPENRPGSMALAQRRFWFDHLEFTEACDAIGPVLSHVLPDLATWFNKEFKVEDTKRTK